MDETLPPEERIPPEPPPEEPIPPEEVPPPVSERRPFWQWLLIIVIAGLILLGLIYYFVFASPNSLVSRMPTPTPTPSPTETPTPAPLSTLTPYPTNTPYPTHTPFPTQTPSPHPTPTIITNSVYSTLTDSHGTKYLGDPSGRTLYVYSQDPPGSGVSNCTGTCINTWPPYINNDTSATMPTHISYIARPDGINQYTYSGRPLYYYIGDTAIFQTNGQGIDGFSVARF